MIAPYEAFPARDAWVMIAAGSDALFAQAAARRSGCPRSRRTRASRDNPARVRQPDGARRGALGGDPRARLARSSSIASSGRACRRAPILTLDRIVAEPQTEASGMLVPAKHPRLPDYRAVGLPIRWDGERPRLARVPPLLGEHTAEVLAELGYDARRHRGSREAPCHRTIRPSTSRARPTATSSPSSCNRPEALNAMNTAMGEDLLALLRRASVGSRRARGGLHRRRRARPSAWAATSRSARA